MSCGGVSSQTAGSWLLRPAAYALRVETDATLWSVYDSWQTISRLIQNLTSESSRKHTCRPPSSQDAANPSPRPRAIDAKKLSSILVRCASDAGTCQRMCISIRALHQSPQTTTTRESKGFPSASPALAADSSQARPPAAGGDHARGVHKGAGALFVAEAARIRRRLQDFLRRGH